MMEDTNKTGDETPAIVTTTSKSDKITKVISGLISKSIIFFTNLSYFFSKEKVISTNTGTSRIIHWYKTKESTNSQKTNSGGRPRKSLFETP